MSTDHATTDTGLGEPIAQSADPIDRVVRLAPKWTVFVLVACALLVVGALVWAFNGTISQTVSTPGILKDNGFQTVAPTERGLVKEVLVTTGDTVTAQQPVLTFESGSQLVAPTAGSVSAIYVAPGSMLEAGAAAVGITDTSLPDVVYTLLPAAMIGTVVADLPVEMEVSSAPSSTYGYLEGRVVEVSSTPLTTEQVATSLGMQVEVVELALGSKPGLLTVIALDPNPDTPSRYSWTVGDGPSFTLVQGTPVTAKVILNSERPIELLFPSVAGVATGALR